MVGRADGGMGEKMKKDRLIVLVAVTLLVALGVVAGCAGGAPNDILGGGAAEFLYVISEPTTCCTGVSPVSSFSIDTGTGNLTAVNTVNANVGSTGTAFLDVSPDGTLLFVGEGSLNKVGVIKLDSTGHMSAPTEYATASTGPMAADFVKPDPTGKFLYFTDYFNGSGNRVGAMKINADGSLSPISIYPLEACPVSLTIPKGKSFLYIADTCGDLVIVENINPDGSLTFNSTTPLPGACNPWFVTADPTGSVLFVVDNSCGLAWGFTIGANGSLTPTNPATASANTGAFATDISPTAAFGYIANWFSDNVSSYKVSNNTLVSKTDVGTTQPAVGLRVDPSGGFVYVALDAASPNGGVGIFKIDPTAGTLTKVGNTVTGNGMVKPFWVTVH